MIIGASIKETPHQLSNNFLVQWELIHLGLFSPTTSAEGRAHQLKNSASLLARLHFCSKIHAA